MTNFALVNKKHQILRAMNKYNTCKVQLEKLSAQVAEALVNFQGGSKTLRDRLELKASLLSVASSLPSHVEYEGKWIEVGNEQLANCDECIHNEIALVGEIPSHITSRYSSGSIGYMLLADSYNPNAF